jgi:predicted metal-dependent TIM-barrel fold hydrolase
LNKNSKNEMAVLERHVDIAARRGDLILVHTPHLEDKLKGTRLILDVLSADSRIDPARVLVDHAEEHTLGAILDRGFWAGITLYPVSKASPARAVDMLETCGVERICLNSAADWGDSDPIATLRAAQEMRMRGHGEDVIERVLWHNPNDFLGQCPKFEPAC